MQDKAAFEEYYKTRDIDLRNELVEKYLYIVDVLIKKYQGKGIDREDIYQVGATALILAVERFDPSRGFEFTTFATPTILGEVKKYFRDRGWSMKVPRRLKETAIAIPKAKEKLSIKYGRLPTTAELAEEMNIKEEDLLEAKESSLVYESASLDEVFEESGGKTVYEKYTSSEDSGYAGVESREIIEKVLSEMSDTNRYIFKKRFIEEQTQAEIAKALGVSQMTVSRAEKKLKEHFRKEMEKE
jgi:RNA polymerase sigma-B factor